MSNRYGAAPCHTPRGHEQASCRVAGEARRGATIYLLQCILPRECILEAH